jgi:hypothetical protein
MRNFGFGTDPSVRRQKGHLSGRRSLGLGLFESVRFGKGNGLSNSLLKLIFNATTITSLAINATASPYTNLEVSLHTSSPGASGDQTTNEIAYTSYTRVAVARTTGGWTASSAQSTSPVATISFPTGGGGSGTATHAGIGTDHTGSGNLYYFGTVTPNIVTGSGITPQLTTASTVTES